MSQAAPLQFVPRESSAPPPEGVRRVATATLGCKVNQFESEAIRQALAGADYTLVPFDTQADCYLINTCTVTAEADRQARQQVRRAIRTNPEALVVVTGCYAQRDPESVAAIPGVDLVLGNGEKLDVHGLIPDLAEGALPQVVVGDPSQAEAVPAGLLERFEDRTRAFLQVQQGCDQSCTYCVISGARGGSRSVPLRQVVRQVDRWVALGVREIVLTGVDIGCYGEDRADCPDLAGLVAAVAERPGDFRLRLSSIDPTHISDALVALFAAEPKLCPHLHLSLQHGDELILKRMKRRYGPDLVRERVAALRTARPGLALGADVLVGFPTEDEERFARLEGLIDELDVAFPHVFPFSGRPGTPAARIPEQVPKTERKARAARVRAAGEAVRGRRLAAAVGTPQRVLVEGDDPDYPGWRRGRAGTYDPVRLPAEWAEPGTFVEVVPQAVRDGVLVAG